MPFYPGDYLKDTMHLNTQEHGAYFLLLLAYWCNGGPLAADDKTLKSITKLDDWTSTKATIAKFFIEENGTWRHKRIDTELSEARDQYTRRFNQTRAARETREVRSVTGTVTEVVTVSETSSVTAVQPQPQPPVQREDPPTPLKVVAGGTGASSLKFDPVKHGLYPREYKAMLEVADHEIERLKKNPAGYERVLSKDAADLIALLESEKNTDRVAAIKARADSWRRGAIKPWAAANLQAWKDRKAEISSAMNGVAEGAFT